MSVDWRFIGEAKGKGRKFKTPNRIDYLIKEDRCKHNGREDLAETALNAAKHVNQLEDNDDDNSDRGNHRSRVDCKA